MTALVEILGQARFPLYGIRPVHWRGPSYVGDAMRDQGALTQVSIVYQHEDDLESGVCVSSIDPRHHPGEAIEAHLIAFVSRFDPGFVMKRNKPRKSPFPAKDFTTQEAVFAVGGQNAAAHAMRHKSLPLELLRVPLRTPDGVTDVGIAGWRAGVRDLANLVERIDAAFAREMDRANQVAYPFAVEDPPAQP